MLKLYQIIITLKFQHNYQIVKIKFYHKLIQEIKLQIYNNIQILGVKKNSKIKIK